MTSDSTAEPTTVVLVHGLWMTALSWEHWVERYEARGLNVIARSSPGMEGDIDALRADTSEIDDVGIADILEHYSGIIEGLDSPLDHHGALVRRCLHADPARPRPGRRRR